MPVNRPPWMKDSPAEAAANSKPSWARRTTTEAAKPAEPSASKETPAKKIVPIKVVPKENGDAAPKVVTSKLQSKEIKVPIMTAHTKPAPPPLKKPEPKKEEPKKVEPKKEVSIAVQRAKPKEKTPEESSEEEDDSSEYEYVTETETESEEEKVVKVVEKRPESPKKLAVPLKKVSKSPEKDGKSTDKSQSPEPTFIKPVLKKIGRVPESSVGKERSASPEPKNFRAQLRKVPSNLKAPRLKEKLPEVELKRVMKPIIDECVKKEEAYPHKPSALLSESNKRIPPPPPPMPKSNIPPPPPPPPPQSLKPPADFVKQAVSDKQKQVIDKLKRRPRRRPDWTDMMKEVEEGRKLKHVECNDRSNPIVTSKSITKVQDQFIYETEKATAHNKLLQAIQYGVRLKPTKCNDRSKPILQGLRKFRRQMTLEEQLLKSESRVNLDAPPVQDEEDEMDDIDKVRDDLQSTKQLLALELRSNEALERENKRLLTRVQNLEAELSRERWNPIDAEQAAATEGGDMVLIKSLKDEALEAQKQSKLLEEKYHAVAQQLDTAYKESEEQKRLIASLEKRLQAGVAPMDNTRQLHEAPPKDKDSSPEPEPEPEEESEEEEDEEKRAEKIAKKLNREVKMMQQRLSKLKEKQDEKKCERQALKYAMKTNQYALKNEKKKYKKLQKEVDKMAAMMKEEEDDEDEEHKPEPEPEEPDEAEEESEEESESEESESDSEAESSNEAEDAPDEKKKLNLDPRVKRHEGRLASLKKGNYLLQANVDRMKDEINKVRETCCTLQADLDSVIADLG